MDVNISHFANKIRFYVIHRFRNIMRFQFALFAFCPLDYKSSFKQIISLLFFKTDDTRVLEIF